MLQIKRIDEFRWEIPKGSVPGMRVPGIVYADERMVASPDNQDTFKQIANVATLPGIVKASLAMPDFHFGYGFPIGGVMASDIDDGIVSPGGVGFDINCGVRLLTAPLRFQDIKSDINRLVKRLFSVVPAGVGSSGKIKLSQSRLEDVVIHGCRWAVKNGYGNGEDLLYIEDGGCLPGVDAGKIGNHAYQRGKDQLGTLGSGNHFIEIQRVDEIFDDSAAAVYGLERDQITIMIHSGSRGLGHQICTDYLKIMSNAARKFRFNLPDRQLACAPVQSPEGQDYLGALQGAANYAWVNRQCMSHWVREVLSEIYPRDVTGDDVKLVYDVAHNIVKIERHPVDGRTRQLAVHRKGATRAFGPGSDVLPRRYVATGQPVIIPGDMGTASYVLRGTDRAMIETFGSACHGAGRILSRKAAQRVARGRSIVSELEARGIYVAAAGRSTIAEEMPEAYKNIDDVIRVVKGAGIAGIVAKMIPLGVIKG
ncbi:RtcB family protein [bacterium]|nr:RtcB family protein [candidate division CSSED10-310 bacterium]